MIEERLSQLYNNLFLFPVGITCLEVNSEKED